MLRYVAVVLGTLAAGLVQPASAVDSVHACPRTTEALPAILGWSVVVSPAGSSPGKAERLVTCLPANVLVIAPNSDRTNASVSRLPALR